MKAQSRMSRMKDALGMKMAMMKKHQKLMREGREEGRNEEKAEMKKKVLKGAGKAALKMIKNRREY